MASKQSIEKFSTGERIVHWVGAVSFLICAVTGLFLFTSVLDFLAPIFGGKVMAGKIHVVSALFFALTPLLSIILIPKRLFQFLKDITTITSDDFKFLGGFLPYILNDPNYKMPPQDKYNGGEKLQSISQIFGGVLLIITGFIIWFKESFSPGLVQIAIPIHSICAIVNIVFAMGHIFFAMVNPRSNAALTGMTNGHVPVEKIKTSNSKWYQQLVKEGKI